MDKFLEIYQHPEQGQFIRILALEGMNDGREGIAMTIGCNGTHVEVRLSDDDARQAAESLRLALFRRWQAQQRKSKS